MSAHASAGFSLPKIPGSVRRETVLEIDGETSSQLLTGLLMALPMAPNETTIRVRNLRSTPYIDMTLDVLRRFGIDVEHRDYKEFYVPGGQRYKLVDFTVEGDWSAAAFFLVAGAIAGRRENCGVAIQHTAVPQNLSRSDSSPKPPRAED